MRRLVPIFALIAACWATSALGQAPPYPSPYGTYPGGVSAAIADQHRHANDRLRLQAETNAALAQRQQIETRQRLVELEAARGLNAPSAFPARPLYDVSQERTLREAATTRRENMGRSVTQIDDWLDRPN
ncbi:MAG: hypothetical protein ACK4OJ_10790 [Brevundimonas sp.]